MAANTFLKPATKEKAILKLSTIEIKMGYPDSMDPVYAKIHVDEYKSLLDVTIDATRLKVMDSLMKLWEPVDKSKWLMPGHMVNACYNPFANDITFPAAILQAPFYSIKQSKEENLGGIGAVIGHEISHAFDVAGSQYDKDGRLTDWWTDEDREAFSERAQKLIDYYNKIEPLPGIRYNGEHVQGEAIADLGGVKSTLRVASKEKDFDYDKYFTNIAEVWAVKRLKSEETKRITQDEHPVPYLRVNIPVQQYDEFVETYGVKEGDGMYVAPEDRICVW